MSVPVITRKDMLSGYVAREGAMKGSDLAFLDQRIPAHAREIVNVIGMGVVENPEDEGLIPKIPAPAHGFSVGYIRAKRGCGAGLHAHATEEVFIPIHGQWQIHWLEGDTERSVELDVGDTINVPVGIYRGFRCACDDENALLLAVVGGPDPGKPAWHPSVIEAARETGLEVDDEGNLRDATS
jgi:mannose-6-phosphate isomerase-like protein (cupin superfamily)